jgi:putative ABC transport system substrate-binding protein
MVTRGGFPTNRIPLALAGLFFLVIFVVSGAVPSFGGKKVVAAVLTSDVQRYREAHNAFVRALAQKGYDQSTTEIIVQTPNPDAISWANTIRKFEAIRVDVIVTYGAPITLVAMRETQETPIVFVDVYGPVETGISRSMSVSGKNLTGVSSKVPMITLVKTIQEFKHIKRMGVIYNAREAGSLVQFQELKRIAAQYGFAVKDVNILFPSGLDAALNTMLPKVDCLYISECSIGSRQFEKIVARANSYKVPVISQMPDAAEKGALVSLEVNPAEQGQLAAEYVVKIMNGVIPGRLSIGTPKKIELIINMRAAKALDLHVPFQGLSAATKILK